MCTTAKRTAIISLIFASIHTFMGIILIAFAKVNKFSFYEMFALIFYIATGAIILISLCCAIHSMSTDFAMGEEYNAERINSLKKQVEELEHIVKR